MRFGGSGGLAVERFEVRVGIVVEGAFGQSLPEPPQVFPNRIDEEVGQRRRLPLEVPAGLCIAEAPAHDPQGMYATC